MTLEAQDRYRIAFSTVLGTWLGTLLLKDFRSSRASFACLSAHISEMLSVRLRTYPTCLPYVCRQDCHVAKVGDRTSPIKNSYVFIYRIQSETAIFFVRTPFPSGRIQNFMSYSRSAQDKLVLCVQASSTQAVTPSLAVTFLSI